MVGDWSVQCERDGMHCTPAAAQPPKATTPPTTWQARLHYTATAPSHPLVHQQQDTAAIE